MHGNNMNSANQSTVERHVKVWNAVIYCGLYLLLSHSRSVLKLSLCCFLHFFHLMNMKRMLLSLSLHQKAHNKCRFLLLTDTLLTPAGYKKMCRSDHAFKVWVQTLTAAFFTGFAFSTFLWAFSNSTSLQVLLKSISFIGHNNCVTRWTI